VFPCQSAKSRDDYLQTTLWHPAYRTKTYENRSKHLGQGENFALLNSPFTIEIRFDRRARNDHQLIVIRPDERERLNRAIDTSWLGRACMVINHER